MEIIFQKIRIVIMNNMKIIIIILYNVIIIIRIKLQHNKIIYLKRNERGPFWMPINLNKKKTINNK